MDIDNLHNLKRRDLQRLCKANNIKANMKNNDMIEKLTELYASKESVLEKVGKHVPDHLSEQNEKVCSTNTDVISESVVDSNQTLHTNTTSVNKCQYVTKIKESDPNTLSPRSFTDCDRESTHESELLMNVSIKANVGSPSSTREQCLDELDMIANQPLDQSCREDSPPLNNEGSNSIESVQNNLDNLESVPDPPVDAIKPTSTANTNTTTQDSQSLLPDLAINPTINTTATQCNTNTSIQDSKNDESINDNDELQSLSNNSCCDESDKLNRTYTIESPEKHISPDSDPLAALNESLTMSPSVNKLESNHLHGSWRNRAVTSSLTHSQTLVKNTDSESITTTIITSVATKETVDKENIVSKHDEIMSLLDSRIATIMKDPNYVPEITPSTLSSRIPIKKGSITEKFDRIHSREFSKMKSIDQVHQSRKRTLESTTDGPTVGGRVSKKPKIQQIDAEMKPPKSVTKPISNARIDRLATPKNKVLKKLFTKQPNSNVKATFK